MKKILYLVKNILYFILTLILGVMLISGEPIAFFIFAFWLTILSFAFLKQWRLIINLLIPDAQKFFINVINPSSYRRAFWVCLLFGVILFVLGIFEAIY